MDGGGGWCLGGMARGVTAGGSRRGGAMGWCHGGGGRGVTTGGHSVTASSVGPCRLFVVQPRASTGEAHPTAGVTGAHGNMGSATMGEGVTIGGRGEDGHRAIILPDHDGTDGTSWHGITSHRERGGYGVWGGPATRPPGAQGTRPSGLTKSETIEPLACLLLAGVPPSL